MQNLSNDQDCAARKLSTLKADLASSHVKAAAKPGDSFHQRMIAKYTAEVAAQQVICDAIGNVAAALNSRMTALIEASEKSVQIYR